MEKQRKIKDIKINDLKEILIDLVTDMYTEGSITDKNMLVEYIKRIVDL